VFSLGLLELSELPVARRGVLKDVKGPWHDDEFRVLEVSGLVSVVNQVLQDVTHLDSGGC